MNLRNLAFGGGAAIVVGLFLPIVSVPILGGMSMFSYGGSLAAVIIMILAAGALFFSFNGFVERAFWPAVAAAGVIALSFAKLQFALAQMRAALTADMKDNPFAGMLQGALSNMIQVQWGWLVLAGGAAVLIYAALQARKEAGQSALSVSPQPEGAIALAALLLFAVPAGQTAYEFAVKQPAALPGMPTSKPPAVTLPSAPVAPTVSQEEANYIRDSLELYALDARYFDSILDGRIPGVTFKIRNKGDRTLNRVTVLVKFYDKGGNAIAEEEYNPVLVSEYSFGDADRPLRPNYIWQGERDQFLTAKNVPSEWEPGKASATITAIEFAPDEPAKLEGQPAGRDPA